jgi:hypothetical protein
VVETGRDQGAVTPEDVAAALALRKRGLASRKRAKAKTER